MSDLEHVDVLVVGAGISGISAAYHLQTLSPDRSYAIWEGRQDLGGTWDLFRYPGVRSDSDMHTLGFSFKPWTHEKAIADGPSILAYLHEAVDEHGIRERIRFQHRMTRAEWSTEQAAWTVTGERGDTGEAVAVRCSFLFMCSGYYSYESGHTPIFEGRNDFAGRIVHPQEWPDDLDHRDQRVVVIGSGATAVTLVPAMAGEAEHVTMLQRSPTWIISLPDRDPINRLLRKVLPESLAYRITRWRNIKGQQKLYEKTRTDPDKVAKLLLALARKQLGPDVDVETHFTPTYDPWDQRLCLIPNGDLFKAIRRGDASVVTDHIDRFTEKGIRLRSGEELLADIIVTATGLRLVTLGEAEFAVDGEPVDFSRHLTYKGVAYSGLPNLASTFGYVNASWTLRADLNAEWVCRVLNHLRDTGTAVATPRLRPSDRDMGGRPWIDDFSANYLQRALDALPRQGDRAPWLHTQSFDADLALVRDAPLEDGVLHFEPAPVAAST